MSGTSEALYIARARIEKVSGLLRRARLATGDQIEMGVHGPIREFYALHPEREAALPVDYVVAAAGG